MAATTIASLAVEITGNTSGLDRAMSSADRSVKGFGGKIQSGLDSIGMGGALALGAMGAAAVKFGTDSVKAAVGFDESMANINSILQLSGGEIDALGGKILAFGANTRAGPQAAADAFYEIVSGVADASTHMAILEASTATAEAGNADLTATTSALVSVMNSYGFSAEEAGFASDVLTKTVGAGVGSMDEFASALGMTAGLAAQSGIEFDELGGSMAYLTTQGFSAAQAGTRLTAITTAFLKPNEKMKKALKAMGLESGSAGLEMYGLAGMTQLLSESMGGSTDAMSEALGTTEALTGALALNGPGFEDFIDNFKATAEGATDAAQAIQNASTAASFDRLNAQVDRLKIGLGELAIPVLEGAANIVVTGLQAGADIIAQVTELGGNLGRIFNAGFEAEVQGINLVPDITKFDVEPGPIRTAVMEAFNEMGGLTYTDAPLKINIEQFVIGLDVMDGITKALNTSVGGMKPIDLLAPAALSLIPPSVTELVTQAGALIDQLNTTGLTPSQRMMINAAVGFEAITTDLPAMVTQIGDTLSGMITTAVEIVTPIAILPNGVTIMPTGMPWLDAALGAVATGADVATAADSPAGMGTMNIMTDLAIIPGGITYETTGIPWIDAALSATAQAELTLTERAALTVGADVTVAGAVVNRDGLVTDVTGQTNTILDEAAIAVDTPGAISVDSSLANGPQVVTAITGALQSNNFDTTVSATMTVMTTVNQVMADINTITAPFAIQPGMNAPGIGGVDHDGNPATPMATGGKVPYDNFAALLHKGEVVVPADYTDGMGRGGGGVTVNIFGDVVGTPRQEFIESIVTGLAERGIG